MGQPNFVNFMITTNFYGHTLIFFGPHAVCGEIGGWRLMKMASQKRMNGFSCAFTVPATHIGQAHRRPDGDEKVTTLKYTCKIDAWITVCLSVSSMVQIDFA